MKNVTIITFLLLYQCLYMFAQDGEWNTGSSKDGKVEVKYRFTHQVDSNAQEILIIEDISILKDNLDFNKCISLMKEVSKHKEFTGDHITKKVRETPDSSYIVYYYTKNPWPIANSDCVALMTYHLNSTEKMAEFILTAAPDEYPMGDVNRMVHYRVSYLIQDLGDGTVEITVKGKTSPPVKVPFWLIKSAFPGAPIKALQKFAKVASQ
jgi:hypothetical protein